MRTSPFQLLVASAIAFGASPSLAISYAPSAKISTGMQVVDVAGNLVGTVQSLGGTELVIKTDRHEVRLPVRSFTPDKGRLVFGMSREELNRATDLMLAKALLPGSEVRGKSGALAGRIETVDDQFITVKLQSGDEIRLPRSSVAPSSAGAVLGITVAELKQMVSKASNPTP